MSNPENPITVTFLYSPTTLFAISTRSSSVKNGRLERLSATARMTSSNILAARRTRSWWPSVIGSNVPGYTALSVMASPFQQLMSHRARAAVAPELPTRRQRRRRRRFHMNQRVRGQMRAQQRQHLRKIVGAKRRIEKDDVISFIVRAQKF